MSLKEKELVNEEMFKGLYQLFKKECDGKPIFDSEKKRFFHSFLNWLSNKMFQSDSLSIKESKIIIADINFSQYTNPELAKLRKAFQFELNKRGRLF